MPEKEKKKKKATGKPAEKKPEGFRVDMSAIYPKRGRPPKFERPSDMADAIQKYLNSCFRPMINGFGQPVKDPITGKIVFQQYKPYTISGMAAALNMSRETLLQYGKDERFAEIVERAKRFVEQSTEEILLSGQSQKGAAFSLKNNFGWRDTSEVKNDTTVQMSEEDRALLQKVNGLLEEEE